MEKIEDCVELQYFLQAISYFCAASLAWENRPAPDTLIAPVTNLVGHGVELTLKANLILRGIDPPKNHKLNELWQVDANRDLRECVYHIAELHGYSVETFDKRIDNLSGLYCAGKRDYPLRYTASSKLESSYSAKFVDTFVTVAKIGVGTSIGKLKSNKKLSKSASELESKYEASVWPKWRPKI